MTSILWAGGEDSDFVNVGVSTVSTTAVTFRSSFARCSLRVPANSANNAFWRIPGGSFSTSDFWFTARVSQQITVAASSAAGAHLIRFLDAAGLVRLRLRNTGTGTSDATGPWAIEKVNAAGTATQLGSNTTFTGFLVGTSASPGAQQKIDVQCTYAVAGSLNIYLDNVLLFTFSGDVTTDANTTINGVDLGSWGSGQLTSIPLSFWSEVIIGDSTTDTRSLSLLTAAPVANGNTHNFDVGTPAAANVNETTLSDATIDGAASAGLIDEYTCAALPAGSFTPLAFGVSARLQKGTSGPSKMDLAVRTGGTDFFSADKTLVTAWANYQNWWQTNPNTTAAWATTEIGNAAGFNIGLKSVT